MDSLTPSDLFLLQQTALTHLVEGIGLSPNEARMSIEFDTLAIEILQPWVADYFQDNQANFCSQAYLATGVCFVDVYFLDQFLFGFAVECGIDIQNAPMVATLEKPVESPGQIELPVADVKVEVEEQLYPIDNLIVQISRCTGLDEAAILKNIEILNFKRFKVGNQTLISERAIEPILARWANAIAAEVRVNLQESPVEPKAATKAPTKPAAKPRTGTGTKKTAPKAG